jgi:hypothetical protein
LRKVIQGKSRNIHAVFQAKMAEKPHEYCVIATTRCGNSLYAANAQPWAARG